MTVLQGLRRRKRTRREGRRNVPKQIRQMQQQIAERRYDGLEAAWTQAVGDADLDATQLARVLEDLVKAGQGETAELLGWSAVGELRGRLNEQELLEVLKAFYIPISTSGELHEQLISQYKQVYREHGHIERLIEASGLVNREKSPRMAFRMLDLCLNADVGTYLLSRRDDTVARVVEVAEDSSSFTVEYGGRKRRYDPAELASEFGPVDPDDIRVLHQFRHDRLKEMLDSDPVALVTGIVQQHKSWFTADDLKFELCPKFLPADQWNKWWSRTRALLKKYPYIRMEGRTPVGLVYDPAGWSLEQQSMQDFQKADTGPRIHAAVEAYLREVRAQDAAVSTAHLSALAAEIQKKLRHRRREHPGDALALALVLDGLVARGATPPPEATAPREIIASAPDPIALLCSITEARLWPAALDAACAGAADGGAKLLGDLLPVAPMSACELVAQRLTDLGRRDLLAERLGRVFEEPFEHIGALCWVWKGGSLLEGLSIPPRVELLIKMLGVLAESTRLSTADREQLLDARAAIRAALSANNYAEYKRCLDGVEESMASMLRNQISRLDQLGVVIREDLIEEIRKRFPGLWVKPKVAPWKDENTLYCTHEGLAKIEKDIHHLVNVEMVENAKAIGAAAEHGDLSENSEYKFALEARDMLRARLLNMQSQVAMHRLIETEEIPVERVGIGSKVTLRREPDGQEKTMTFVGPWEADVNIGLYNYKAPLSQELMGRAPGEAVVIQLDGPESSWRIEKIERGL